MEAVSVERHGVRSIRPKILFYLGLAISLVTAVNCSYADTPVYFNNFEDPCDPLTEWSPKNTSVTPAGSRRFLGVFGNDSVSLTLNGLPSHDYAVVSFDLFIMKSWDGNHDINDGPDVWTLTASQIGTLLCTTFCNVDCGCPDKQGYDQAFPGIYPADHYSPRAGATEVKTLGYHYLICALGHDSGDTVYHLMLPFPHSDDSLQLSFSASGLEELNNENWGLENVSVSVVNSSTVDDHELGEQSDSGSANDPVNTAIGNFTHHETDISVATRGGDFAFRRFYNSLDDENGPLGFGWTHTYNIYLTQDANSVISIKWDDGRKDRYIEQSDGTCTPLCPGQYDHLLHAGNMWTLRKRDLTTYLFDWEGKLISITDRNGNSFTCSYDEEDRLQTVTDPVEREMTFTSSWNFIEQITDPNGRTVSFTYSGNYLTEVNDTLGNTILYTYDGRGYLQSITDQRNVTTVHNVYDARGRVIEQHDGNDNTSYFQYYTPNDTDTTIIDPNGDVIVHSHEGYLLKKITYPALTTMQYNYDSLGNRTAIKDRNGSTASFEYDGRGNLTRTIAPDGGITEIEYNAPNLPDLATRKTDPTGTISEWQYDANGNTVLERRAVGTELQCQRTWTYNKWGQVLTETDEANNVTTYHYDTTPNREGLLLWIEDANGNRIWYDHDELWRRTTVTDARASALDDPCCTTKYTYDNAGRITDINGPIAAVHYEYDNVGNQILARDGQGNVTTYEYDNNSNLRFVREPMGRTTQYTYDYANRRTNVIDPCGHQILFAYDRMGNLVTETRIMSPNEPNLISIYEHDAFGNITSTIDPSGRMTTYSYDPMGRKTSEQDDLGHIQTWKYDYLGRVTDANDMMGNTTSYAYDALGRLVAVTALDYNSLLTTQYEYNITGNLTQIIDANGRCDERDYDEIGRMTAKRDGLSNEYRYTYDPVGNLISITDPCNNTATMDYDGDNRLTAIHYPDMSQVSFTYDKNSNRLTMTDPTGTTTYAYDSLNRLTNSTDSFGKHVAYAYDLVGNRTSLTYPGDLTVNYTYDNANRLITVTDWADRTATYHYDQAGRITDVNYANNTNQHLTYDAAGRLLTLDYQNDGGSFLGYEWLRDAQGNPIVQCENGTLPPDLSLLVPQVTYNYDSDNRLVAASQGTYHHNARGNLTSRTVGGTQTTFHYDFEDRLIRQTTDGNMVEHIYDGAAYRIARIENGKVTRYVLDRSRNMSHVLCETTGDGNVIAYYVHGPEILCRIDANNSPSYYHTDQIGSVVALTNASGTVSDRYAYSPFGIPAGSQGDTPNPFRYVGGLGVMAENDDIYFMRARFYDPGLGRFLSKDPLEGFRESPATYWGYVYAFDNPIGYHDPQGTSSVRVITGAAGGLVNVIVWGVPEMTREVYAWYLYSKGKISAGEFRARVMAEKEFKKRGRDEYLKGWAYAFVPTPGRSWKPGDPLWFGLYKSIEKKAVIKFHLWYIKNVPDIIEYWTSRPALQTSRNTPPRNQVATGTTSLPGSGP